MPHKPQPAPHPNTKTHITIPIPGWLKNELITSAQTHNQSLQKHINHLLTNALRHTQNKPPLQNTPPNPIQPIINYLTGTRTLQPCGQPTCNKQPITLNNTTYCNTCGIQTN
jgi:hypothetical protein